MSEGRDEARYRRAQVYTWGFIIPLGIPSVVVAMLLFHDLPAQAWWLALALYLVVIVAMAVVYQAYVNQRWRGRDE